MRSLKTLTALATGVVALTFAAPALAQTQSQGAQQERVGAILGALFGNQTGTTASIESQWTAGRTPLNTQRTQFSTQVDSSVRAGTLSSDTAGRLRADYDSLAQLETRYGADGRFTTAERTELADKYGELTQVLADGQYAGQADQYASAAGSGEVAAGQSEFEGRVATALSSRRITRTQATSLRTDYQALISTETRYAPGGFNATERADLDRQLDLLDARLGDVSASGGATVSLDPRTRLANIDTAVGRGSVGQGEAAEVRAQLGDLTRLEAAYSRTNPSTDDRAYLTRRIGELEARARVTAYR